MLDDSGIALGLGFGQCAWLMLSTDFVSFCLPTCYCCLFFSGRKQHKGVSPFGMVLKKTAGIAPIPIVEAPAFLAKSWMKAHEASRRAIRSVSNTSGYRTSRQGRELEIQREAKQKQQDEFKPCPVGGVPINPPTFSGFKQNLLDSCKKSSFGRGDA